MRSMLSLFVTALVACSLPPLAVESEGGSVVLNLQTLGEYPSPIRRLQLSEISTGQVIWEMEIAEGSPQVWRVPLSVGENDSDINERIVGGRLQVKVPREKDSFVILAGKPYRFEVWGEGPRSARVSFVVEGAEHAGE